MMTFEGMKAGFDTLKAKIDSGEMKDSLETILRQAKRMSRLIAQLLELARVDNGKLKPEWETVDMTELCAMVAEEMELQAETAGLRIVTDLQPDV